MEQGAGPISRHVADGALRCHRGLVLRLDLHLHTMWSGDSTTTPEELSQAISSSALDGVAVTDHNTIAGALALIESGELSCPVIVGEEVRTVGGDVIGLFLSERIPAGLKPLDAAALIREQGGIVYVPHPGDGSRHSLGETSLEELSEAGLLDVVEVLNSKCPRPYDGPTFGAAEAGASDAHVPAAVGAAWTEVDDCDLADPQSVLAALHAGSPAGGHFDPPRQWSRRIVPAGLSLEGRP
ncbi:MAG TPA: PHP-associated domain-containing protein [Acidimicrobiales bacterium]|nr:PHP-associated domain-containing protein [Acidimicrobiales bacterium]